MFREDINNPIKVPCCIYNNTCIIIPLVLRDYTIDEMRRFLEIYGYFYPNEEIEDFLGTDFFKRRMDEYLEETDASDEIKESYRDYVKSHKRKDKRDINFKS